MFYAITNPGGTGIASAKEVEKVADFYANVIEMTGKVLEKARVELKDVQWLGDKAAAMQQGFYLEKEDGTQEAHDAIEASFSHPRNAKQTNKTIKNKITLFIKTPCLNIGFIMDGRT